MVDYARFQGARRAIQTAVTAPNHFEDACFRTRSPCPRFHEIAGKRSSLLLGTLLGPEVVPGQSIEQNKVMQGCIMSNRVPGYLVQETFSDHI